MNISEADKIALVQETAAIIEERKTFKKGGKHEEADKKLTDGFEFEDEFEEETNEFEEELPR